MGLLILDYVLKDKNYKEGGRAKIKNLYYLYSDINKNDVSIHINYSNKDSEYLPVQFSNEYISDALLKEKAYLKTVFTIPLKTIQLSFLMPTGLLFRRISS